MHFFKNKLSIKSVMLMFVLSVLSLVLWPEAKAEASFHHTHTEDCYEMDTFVCSNHHLRDYTGTNTYHCFTCQKMTTFSELIWWDHCDNGYRPMQDVAYQQTCTVCGSMRRDEDPGDPRSHTVTAKVLKCGKTEETVAAEVALNIVSPGATNGTVVIDAGVNVLESGFSLAPEAYDFGNGYTSNSTFEVTENGTYSVNIKSSDGQVVSTSVTVNSIDKVAPTISGISKSTEDWSENGVTITVEASDEGLGLAEKPYSYNGGDYTDRNTFLVRANQTVTVSVKDAAGNITTGSIEIKNVGRDPAVVAREREEEARREAEEAAKKKAEEERLALEEANKKAQAEALAKEKNAKDKAAKEKAEKEASQKELKENKTTAKNGLLNMLKADDVSKNDVSENEESNSKGTGREIKLTDLSNQDKNISEGKKGDTYTLEIESLESLENIDSGNQETLIFAKASAGKLTLIAGIILIAVSLLFASFFNYIYVSEEGKKRLISLCKVDITKDAVVVNVPSKKLDKKGKYLIYFSPLKKVKIKKLRVVVKVEGENREISTDCGNTFMY